jgi:hypothetical protein
MAPYRSDLWADERLANKLAELGGRIFAPSYGGYLTATPSSQQADIGALQELTGVYGGGMTPLGTAWLRELHAALDRRDYDYVLLDSEWANGSLAGTVSDAGFVRVGPLFPPGDQLWTWRRSGNDTPPGLYITPKVDVYVPRERAASAGSIRSRPAASQAAADEHAPRVQIRAGFTRLDARQSTLVVLPAARSAAAPSAGAPAGGTDADSTAGPSG